MSINLDSQLEQLCAAVSATRQENHAHVVTFAQAVQGASRAADGRKLELLRACRQMARRMNITLPETEKIDSIWLSKQMIGESIDSRIALKNALHVAGLLA
jgi:hypothetical protein